MNFCSGGAEEFNVTRAYDLPVLAEGLGAVLLRAEEYKGIPRGAPIRFPDEEHAVLVVQDVAAVLTRLEEVNLPSNNKKKKVLVECNTLEYKREMQLGYFRMGKKRWNGMGIVDTE